MSAKASRIKRGSGGSAPAAPSRSNRSEPERKAESYGTLLNSLSLSVHFYLTRFSALANCSFIGRGSVLLHGFNLRDVSRTRSALQPFLHRLGQRGQINLFLDFRYSTIAINENIPRLGIANGFHLIVSL